MPSQKSPRRVSKKAVSPAHLAKRRSLKPRKPRPAPYTGDALLIAQFAEALGQAPRKRTPAVRRSLTESLKRAAPMDDLIGIMPGARVAPARLPQSTSDEVATVAPCIAAHRRQRFTRKVSGAASWCFAFAVTAGIVSAAAYGFVSYAPGTSVAPITTASAAQF
jgi:hypothetical protein